MSMWYDKKGKCYASKGSSSWVRYYAEHICQCLRDELLAKLTRHYRGLEGVHTAEQIQYDPSTSVKTAIDAAKSTADTQLAVLESAIRAESDLRERALEGKVDKEEGKALSSNDYSDADKEKLSAIEDGAQVNTVTSVAGRVGAVMLEKADVGLAHVDNTADADKPISSAVQSALNQKADLTAGKVDPEQLPYFNTSYTLKIDGTPIYGCRFVDVDEEGKVTLHADGSGDWLLSVTEEGKVAVTKVVQTDEIDQKADQSAVLTKTNTERYIPTENYHPATKQYVDSVVSAAGGGDMMQTVYDQNQNGIVDNAEKLGGQPPSYYAAASVLDQKADLMHRSAADTYGVGTATLYGHCRVTDHLSQTEYQDGEALSAHQGAVLNGKIAEIKNAYFMPPTLTAVTPKGTKIGTSAWTGTGFYCTEADTLYQIEDNNHTLPNAESYTRFCLRPADLSDSSYRYWTPYFVSGSTEIEFVWSPARGLYDGLVLKDETKTAQAFMDAYIIWRYQPPVCIRYGKTSNYFNVWHNTTDRTSTDISIGKRAKDCLRDFGEMLCYEDYQTMSCKAASWLAFEDIYADMTPTEINFFILAWDVLGTGSIATTSAFSALSKMLRNITAWPLPIETIDRFGA